MYANSETTNAISFFNANTGMYCTVVYLYRYERPLALALQSCNAPLVFEEKLPEVKNYTRQINEINQLFQFYGLKFHPRDKKK